MAIVWSTQYPGQISIDPDYPHGKPRNVVVPGDGSGTPLEAAWVSDLAGWQAALLQEAGITPSGQPDKLGASDYTNAIKAIAGGTFDGFTEQPHTWTAQQTFTSGYIANNFGVQGEVLYTDAAGVATPKTRTVQLPFSGLAAEGNETTQSWYFAAAQDDNSAGRRWMHAPGQTGKLFAEFTLPGGSSLLNVRVGLEAVSAGTVVVRVGKHWSAFIGEVPQALQETAVEMSMTAPGIYTLTVPPDKALLDPANQSWFVSFSSNGITAVDWIKVTYLDPGPRNF